MAAVAAAVPLRVCHQEIVKFDLEIKAAVQDIRDCPGPLSALTELNAAVKEKFRQLRGRIQVRGPEGLLGHRAVLRARRLCFGVPPVLCGVPAQSCGFLPEFGVFRARFGLGFGDPGCDLVSRSPELGVYQINLPRIRSPAGAALCEARVGEALLFVLSAKGAGADGQGAGQGVGETSLAAGGGEPQEANAQVGLAAGAAPKCAVTRDRLTLVQRLSGSDLEGQTLTCVLP
uniref:BCL2 interacting protein 1 n=1 Tax=Ficedula albicollis TaxID=59894 RepID=A0A803VL02_FICAL